MKIIIAPDKFKGSLTASAVCDIMEQEINQFNPTIEVLKIPLADGGEGTLDIIESYGNCNRITVTVNDPLFRPIEAYYLLKKNTAYIELATASGLQLLNENERNCLYTSSYGTGELILNAYNKGAKQIFLFVGGSATNDAGIGIATALGYQFINKSGNQLKPIGKHLVDIDNIRNNKLKIDFSKTSFTVVCDVKNPLFGKKGAAYVYAKQKGADKNAIKVLDIGLENFAHLVKKTMNKQVAYLEGGGAAGGIGAGAVALLNATIKSGITTILDIVNFKNLLHNTDLVITGEGKLDSQTLEGKVVHGVAITSQKNNVPVIVVAGTLDILESKLTEIGISKVFKLKTSHMTTQEAIKNARALLEKITVKLSNEFLDV